jgi:hypothetical protein
MVGGARHGVWPQLASGRRKARTARQITGVSRFAIRRRYVGLSLESLTFPR